MISSNKLTDVSLSLFLSLSLVHNYPASISFSSINFKFMTLLLIYGVFIFDRNSLQNWRVAVGSTRDAPLRPSVQSSHTILVLGVCVRRLRTDSWHTRARHHSSGSLINTEPQPARNDPQIIPTTTTFIMFYENVYPASSTVHIA